ncbi:hypothetical protein Gorai_024429 [Gossypium raimondii]|uniref:DUF4283 domain-containing protein n=1 Tax=Gossypium raimondii TaxID=29730 RepID=A0A7J8NZE9_GOSRA|nr:hypothetical protein [Gossypium raimondii]
MPSIKFSDRVHKLMEMSMAWTVVAKLLGRRIWKFSDEMDFIKVLLEGPWVLYDRYLIVQQWTLKLSVLQPYPLNMVTSKGLSMSDFRKFVWAMVGNGHLSEGCPLNIMKEVQDFEENVSATKTEGNDPMIGGVEVFYLGQAAVEEIEDQDRNIEILENQNATKDGEEEPKQYSKGSSSRLPDKDPKKISPSAGIRDFNEVNEAMEGIEEDENHEGIGVYSGVKA